jgi:DNA repair exonuclease SbcCD ATPase subunit
MTLRIRYEKIKTKKEILQSEMQSKRKHLDVIKVNYENLIKARWILTEVAKETQIRFKERVESLVTMAIQAVYNEPFRFVLEFERKRNKLECRPVVMEGDAELVPKDDMGGGIIDIISFALRVVLWSLQQPRSRNTLILDEPMLAVGDLIDKAGQMLREVSHRLGIQLIIVTHATQLAEIADIAYHVERIKGKSVVKMIKGQMEKPKLKLKRRKK